MRRRVRAALLAGVAALGWGVSAPAQTPPARESAPGVQATPAPRPVPPQRFASPEQGFTAFVEAVAADDERRLLRILGSAGRRLIRSGDPVADREARSRFVTKYRARSEILRPAADRAELQVGEDGWPLPVPMVQRAGHWQFDTAAAEEEILNRRIGRNELNTIETLRAIADAQVDYADGAGREGVFRRYARRFFSSPGAQDGLYWAAAEGEAESPLGPLVAAASAEGYAPRREGQAAQPYHGYVFRMLERQGASAPGGAIDYVVAGRMIGGFAVIAVPAQYGSTGIKTFMISHRDTVWEADLGPTTTRVAARITAFDPGPGWTRVAE